MVPALFSEDEKEPILAVARPVAKKMQILESGVWAVAVNMLKDALKLTINAPCGIISLISDILRLVHDSLIQRKANWK